MVSYDNQMLKHSSGLKTSIIFLKQKWKFFNFSSFCVSDHNTGKLYFSQVLIILLGFWFLFAFSARHLRTSSEKNELREIWRNLFFLKRNKGAWEYRADLADHHSRVESKILNFLFPRQYAHKKATPRSFDFIYSNARENGIRVRGPYDYPLGGIFYFFGDKI